MVVYVVFVQFFRYLVMFWNSFGSARMNVVSSLVHCCLMWRFPFWSLMCRLGWIMEYGSCCSFSVVYGFSAGNLHMFSVIM